MEVLTLQFTRNMGIAASALPEYLLQLNYSKKILNHINTVHASASFALAEITSGYYLNANFIDIADQTIPILRTSTIKFRKGATGNLYSTAKFINTSVKEIQTKLLEKRKVQLTIQVKLFNDQKELVMTGEFDWFVSMR